MHRPGAAERDQREISRVVAALDRDDAQGFGHVAVDDLDDLGGSLGNLKAERRCDIAGDRGFGGGCVDRQIAAQQRFAVEIAEHDVGVADGRMRAAAPIGGGAGEGAGAVRPDLQCAAGIDPGDAAAAGADLGKVDDRHPHRVAGALQPALGRAAADLVLGGDGDLAVGDQARLGGGAAHVERNQIGEAELRPGEAGRDDPRRRPAFDRHRRHAQSLGHFEHATARPHYVKRRQAEPHRRALEPVEIGGKQGADIGAHCRRADPLELADLRQDLARQVDADPGQCGPQSLAEAALMRVVEEREQQRYCDGVELGIANRRDDRVDLGLGERRHDFALGADALGNLEAPASRHQHVGRVLQQIVEIGARRAAQLQKVAKAARRDEPGARALFLEQGVGDDRRRVRQECDAGRVDALALDPARQPLDHGAR